MTSAMMMERPMMMGSGTSMPTQQPGMTTTNMVMVPRCDMKFEKCDGGMRVVCRCADEVACATLQNMCRMMAGGMLSCCCMMNGMTVCQCNLFCGMCQCEYTKDGCTFTCTSGDKSCCAVLQSCCQMMQTCQSNGCCCCIMMNGTPVCCSVC
jgi:hypothetical protein